MTVTLYTEAHFLYDLHFLLHASYDLHPYHTHAHTMHHLFFPFSASVILLSLAFFFPPISTLHLWFTILSMAIAFLFLSFEIVCVKALVGMGVWGQRFVCSFGHVRWCFIVIRKNQIAIITRFWLFLGKKLAHAKCTDVMWEYCGLLPEHCWCSDLTCFYVVARLFYFCVSMLIGPPKKSG